MPVGLEPPDALSLGRLPRILRDLVEADRSVTRDDVASAKTTTPKAERAMGCGKSHSRRIRWLRKMSAGPKKK